MLFNHEHKEERSQVKASDWYSADIGEHRVLLVINDDLAQLSVSPINWNDGLRLGIIQCHPKSVGELERLAEAAPDLFRAIAKELRELGMDDLRGKWDKMRDEMDQRIAAATHTSS